MKRELVIRGSSARILERNMRSRGFTWANERSGKTGAARIAHQAAQRAGDAGFMVAYSADRAGALKSLAAGAARVPEVAGPFLGLVATMAYDGAEPGRARAWAEENSVTDGAQLVIGAARFAISARDDPALTWLVITPAT